MTKMGKERKEASQCMGKKAPYTCNTTLLAMQGQVSKKTLDPGVTIPPKQVKEWLEIWAAMDEESAAECHPVWERILTETELQGRNQKWRHNRGVLSALIITLQDLDFYPKSPYEWIVKDRGRILKPSREKLRDDFITLEKLRRQQDGRIGMWRHKATMAWG